jgi:hypothetical protein
MRTKSGRLVHQLRFLRTRILSGYTVPERPALDEAGGAYFRERIGRSSVYLEYGCGGSTIHAATHVQQLFAVDTDAWFLNAVRKKLAEQPRRAACHLLHADIGRMRQWGWPTRHRRDGTTPYNWRTYPWAPWQRLWQEGAVPDTILVDGRFRVACAVTSLIHLRADSTTELLVDDYADRRHYHLLEKCATLKAMHGRMAVFTVDPGVSIAILDAELRRHELDWR